MLANMVVGMGGGVVQTMIFAGMIGTIALAMAGTIAGKIAGRMVSVSLAAAGGGERIHRMIGATTVSGSNAPDGSRATIKMP